MPIVNIKKTLQDKRILDVLAHSMFQPDDEKLRRRAWEYQSDGNIAAYGYTDSDAIEGVIILRRIMDFSFEISNIAVDPAYRRQGIGTKLVSYAASRLLCSDLCAETDGDAVDFYRKYGFDIYSLGEKYAGITRYLCTLNRL